MNYIDTVKTELGARLDIENDLLDLYTLLVFVKGENCTLEDIHDAWAIWENNTNEKHKSIVPFKELSKDVQELDREYMEQVRIVAKLFFNK